MKWVRENEDKENMREGDKVVWKTGERIRQAGNRKRESKAKRVWKPEWEGERDREREPKEKQQK